MSPLALSALVDAARRTVRRDAVLAIAALVTAAVPLALLAAWLLGGLPAWSEPGPLPLVVVAGALTVAIALGVAAVRLWLRGIDEGAVAARAEEAAGLPSGSLRGVLELGRSIPAGTSAALFRREETTLSRSFIGRKPAEVSGELGRTARRRLAVAAGGLAGLCVAVAAIALLSPQRTQASWAPLLHPVAHLTPPPLPALEVRPGDAAVARGEALAVSIRAPGRDAVTLVWRAEGSIVEQATLRVTGDSATGEVPRIDSRTTYHVTAPDGARSAEYTITPLDPLLVSELVVEVIFPAYVERTAERYDADVPPLQLPEGTRIQVRGRATRPLQAAGLTQVGGEGAVDLEIDGERFRGEWRPTESGTYDWRLSDRSGESLAASPAPLDITLVPDLPPEVELTWPATDTILPPDLIQLVAADARDDHGLASASVVTWRVSSSGEVEPERAEPIGLDPTLDRSLLRSVLDLTDRGLMPGDTLKVQFRVTDASPRRQTAESRVLSLHLPGLDEMRDRVGDQASELVDDAAEMSRLARQLQDATRDLQRRTAASNARDRSSRQQGNGGRAGGSAGSLDYEQSEQARELMAEQEELLEQMEEMRERLQQFQEAAERAGVQDAELRRQMEELRELYEQLMTPELREQMEELRKALDNMDPEALEKALEKLTEQQDRIREQLEENLDTMRRAASEQQLNALAQEARELAAQQEALSESMRERAPGQQEAQQQEELSRRAEELQQAMQGATNDLQRQGETKAGEEAASASEKAGQASQQMKDAAEDARARRGEDAASQGEQAAERLQEAASTLDGARQAMADRWKQELQETVQQAMNEALSLAQRQQDLLERMQQGEQQQGQQQQGQQQAGQQQAGQQQAGQQQAGQQQGGQQQQSGQQGQQQGGQQQGGQQQAGQQGQQQGGQQGGGQQQGAQMGSGAGGTGNAMQAEQRALQQGLEQLGRNLAEAGDRSQLLDREVGAALGRANLSMQQTLQAMQQQQQQGGQAGQRASETVDALNRLAMSLLQRSQEIESSETGSALEEVLEQLAEAARRQGALNGQSSALMPMNLAPNTMRGQANQLAQEQREIASKLEGLSNQVGRREGLLGQLDQLAREAESIASVLDGGRLAPEAIARQERLFHRLLDAGRTLEKEEYSEERKGELPGDVPVSRAPALDASLLNSADRYRVPTPEELRALPPAYRRLVLEYFARLNRTSSSPPSQQEPPRQR